MQEIVLALVIVYHGACLRLDCDASLALHVQLVQNLLVSSRLDGARELQEAVGKRRLAMVHMCYDAEVAVSFDGYLGDALLEFGLRSEGLRIAPGERREALEGVTGAWEAIEPNGARSPTLQ
jgi:hypothetical protein